jgi:hypothetical protein
MIEQLKEDNEKIQAQLDEARQEAINTKQNAEKTRIALAESTSASALLRE